MSARVLRSQFERHAEIEPRPSRDAAINAHLGAAIAIGAARAPALLPLPPATGEVVVPPVPAAPPPAESTAGKPEEHTP